MTEKKNFKDETENINKAQSGITPDENVTAQDIKTGEKPTDETPVNECEKKKCKSSAEKQLAEENKRLTSKISELTASLEKSDSELGETRDKYMRVLAEYDNFRKRSAKEREGIFADAYSDAMKEILPIIDNLERAAQFTESDTLNDGLMLIFKSAKETLEKLGVEAFGAAGDTFDPLIHNAVMHSEDENAGVSEVVEVFQKGYRKGDRIIRHAMVKVVN